MKKDAIRTEIQQFVSRYQSLQKTETSWQTPLVGFASATDPIFEEFKKVVRPSHFLPCDLLPEAQTVVAFFLPFEKPVATSNIAKKLASREWAMAYVETNALIRKVGQHMGEFIEKSGHAAYITPPTHNFDPKILLSDWSHRHVAFAAGLGRFGLNNMLITEKGCCGRIGSFITTLTIDPDSRSDREACLFKHNGSCEKCVPRCVNDALFTGEFNRYKCYEMLLENEEKYKSLGTADVCGKCLVALPCSTMDPVKGLTAPSEPPSPHIDNTS
jgi:epoxyqueuosine reductase QueG